MKKLTLVVLLSCLAGCPKDAEEAVAPVAGKPPTAEPAKPAPPRPANCNADFKEPLAADTTLTSPCNPYTVDGTLNIDGLTLTIDPGVELRFGDGASLVVGYSKPARVLVKGTQEKPVKFTGKSWQGLVIRKDGQGSSFEHLILENAGTSESPAFKTQSEAISLNAVTFLNAKKTALQLDVDRPLEAVTALDLSKGSADPSELVHANIVTAGSLGAGHKFPADGIIWLHGPLDSDVTLTHPGATFRIPKTVAIDPPEGKTASLTLEQGVTLELGENASLNFGFYRGPAGLKIQGTKEKPVTITRFGQGHSAGLQLFAGASAPEIDFLVLEYAGSAEKAALTHADTRGLGKLTNSTFRHLKGKAIRVDASKERFAAFDHNTFEDVEGAALRVPLHLAHGLGPNNKFTDTARVTLFGGTKQDTTLESLGAPYLVEGELAVNGEASKPATLTIAPGGTLLFNDQGKLSVSYFAPAKLVARGTPEQPVTFGKAMASWGGVGIYGKGSIEVENASLSGTGADVWPLDLTSGVTGTVKALALSDTRKGIHGCAKKVKPQGTTADTGIKPIERCK